MNWDNKDNDPWGNKNDAPDFDELLKKFSAVLGGNKSSSMALVVIIQDLTCHLAGYWLMHFLGF